MLPSLEILEREPEDSFRCRSFDLTHFPFVWHLHPEHELTLIVEGEGRRFVGDHVDAFEAGEVVLLGSNVPHTWYSRADRLPSRSVVVQFRDDCFGTGFFDLPEMRGIRRLLNRAEVGLVFRGQARRDAARRMVALNELRGPQRVLELLGILTDLARSRAFDRLSSRSQTVPLRDRDQTRIGRVLRHVNAHYTEPLSQAEVARIAHLTPAAFSRFFKRMTGTTFVDYLHRLRVARACRQLLESDASITEVCFDAGFGNVSNFNRVFKRIKGVNPGTFRKAMA